MSLQYNVEQKNIFTESRIDTIKFHYSDFDDAEKCFNRLIRQVQKEPERYHVCEIAVNDRTSRRLFKEIKPTR